MKKIMIMLAAVLIVTALCSVPLYAENPDSILGKWFTEKDAKDGNACIEIYKCGDKYCGKIVWLEKPNNDDGTEKLDTKNPDTAKRQEKLLGSRMLWDIRHLKDNVWGNGRVYDAASGNTYRAKIWYHGDTLKFKGSIGLGIGRTTTWSRTND